MLIGIVVIAAITVAAMLLVWGSLSLLSFAGVGISATVISKAVSGAMWGGIIAGGFNMISQFAENKFDRTAEFDLGQLATRTALGGIGGIAAGGTSLIVHGIKNNWDYSNLNYGSLALSTAIGAISGELGLFSLQQEVDFQRQKLGTCLSVLMESWRGAYQDVIKGIGENCEQANSLEEWQAQKNRTDQLINQLKDRALEFKSVNTHVEIFKEVLVDAESLLLKLKERKIHIENILRNKDIEEKKQFFENIIESAKSYIVKFDYAQLERMRCKTDGNQIISEVKKVVQSIENAKDKLKSVGTELLHIIDHPICFLIRQELLAVLKLKKV